MGHPLTSEQVNTVVNNTVVVMLARTDLLVEWHSNLFGLLDQVRQNRLDDEAIFIAAVLTLLHSPDDTLPTGTPYDKAWEAILVGLQTGSVPSMGADDEDEQAMSIDRLLKSVAEAMLAVLLRYPAQKETLSGELDGMHKAAQEAGVPELAAWLADALALLAGTPAGDLVSRHTGIYAAYWDALVNGLSQDQ
jgi:hypothetical protein